MITKSLANTRFVLSAVAAATTAALALGQSAPTTINTSAALVISSGNNSISGQSGTLTSAVGGQGVNPGYSWFRYGTANSGAGAFVINSTSTATASLKYFTAASATPTVNAAPDVFDINTSYTWNIISPKVNSTTPLWVRANDATPVNLGTGAGALVLNNQANLATYNTRLNEIYTFDRSNFLKTALQGGGTVDPLTEGNFTYSFSQWDGTSYRGVDLIYTPVPEPTTVLGLTALGAFGLTRLRRRMPQA